MNDFLKGAFLTLTNKCNLNCKYCYQKPSLFKNTENNLKKEDWFRIIDELFLLGSKRISIVGGEPFLFEDFFEILKYLNDKNFDVKIFTNGHFLNKKNIGLIKKYGFSLSFNLNSANSKIQDFYQKKGSWLETVRSIKLCKKENIEFEIASPLTKTNYSELKEFFSFCKRLGAKRLRLVPLVYADKLDLAFDKINEKEIHNLKKEIEKIKSFEVTIGCRICEGGKHYLTVQPNGDITPCTIRREIIMGNILNESFSDILKKDFQSIVSCIH